MAVVGHSPAARSGILCSRDRSNERIESFLELRWDQIFSAFDAIDRVDVIVGIGMAHCRT